MTDLDHRVGVRENNLVVRNLKLSNVTSENIDALIEEIDQMFGLDEVSFNRKEEEIHLAYDAVNIHDDWWTHTKESYYKFCDQNVKDNFKHEPWSCHKTPPGSIKRKR